MKAAAKDFRNPTPDAGKHEGDGEANKKAGAAKANPGKFWETCPAYASRGGRTLTELERSNILSRECGFTIIE